MKAATGSVCVVGAARARFILPRFRQRLGLKAVGSQRHRVPDPAHDPLADPGVRYRVGVVEHLGERNGQDVPRPLERDV